MREVATTSNAPTSVMPEARLLTARKSARRLRLVPLAIGAAAMAVGIWTGLARLGVALPGGTPALADFHGALMISGFLGTLISLERAVALGRAWPYGAPVLSSLGALALLAGMPHLGALAFILASAVLLSASARIAILQPALFTIVLTTGAACWTAGTAYWLLGHATSAVVGWVLDFLVLAIAADRRARQSRARSHLRPWYCHYSPAPLATNSPSHGRRSRRRGCWPVRHGCCTTTSPAAPFASPVSHAFRQFRFFSVTYGWEWGACCLSHRSAPLPFPTTQRCTRSPSASCCP